MPVHPRPDRTPVVLLTGLDRTGVARLARAAAAPGTTVVTVDLRDVADGQVIRTSHRIAPDGREELTVDHIVIEHGCVSCTLRFDLLPELRRLHRDAGTARIAVALDPAIEPELLCTELHQVVVSGPGMPDGPAGLDVSVEATVCAIDAPSWLGSATGDVTLTEAGLTGLEDERTLAQVAVGQARFADALIVEGADGVEDMWQLVRLHAVLLRLAPAAGMRTLNSRQPLTAGILDDALGSVGADAPRGRPRRPFDPLLAGRPELSRDCGVQLSLFEAARPFHPHRLHEAFDVLLDGVVTAYGRLWLASAPDDVLWLESAGGGLGIGRVGRWLACDDGTEDAGAHLPDHEREYRALAALAWDPVYGDRHTSLAVLTHRADPAEIETALQAALVTDDEFARGPGYLSALDSPIGDRHTDPCTDREPNEPTIDTATTTENGENR